MDPLEWQRLADEAAVRLDEEIAELENSFWSSELPQRSFRAFWTRLRDLNDRVRTAPAIKLDDKLHLQHRLGELSQRARRDQKQLKESVAQRKQELLEDIRLARDSLSEASTVEDTQEVRSDLAALRKRISASDVPFRPDERQDIWQTWQEANQEAWDRLNQQWSVNERYLSSILDEAQQHVETGEPRLAKERVKAFHSAVSAHECSHAALRALRSRANALWRDADELGRQRHEAYLANLGKRMDYWRRTRERNARVRTQLAAEIAELEQRATSAATDVGAALARGQLAERRRALSEIEAADESVARQMRDAELALHDS